GETVHRAQRLESGAAPNELVLGAGTLRLLGANAVTEAAGAGFRLLELVSAPDPERSVPLVGRSRELAQLEDALERATATRSAQLVTVLVEPGIGKSRLTRELRLTTGDRCRTLVGRCLPYGEGISFWPLREMLTAAVGDEL